MSKNRAKGSTAAQGCGDRPEEKIAADLAIIRDELATALKENEFPADDRAKMMPPGWKNGLIKELLTSAVSATFTSNQVDRAVRDFARQQGALKKAHTLHRNRRTALVNLAGAKAQMVKGCPVEDNRPETFTPPAVHDLLIKTIGRNPLIIVPQADDQATLILAEILYLYRRRALFSLNITQDRQDAANEIAALLNRLQTIRAYQEDYLDRSEDDRLTFSMDTLDSGDEYSRDVINRIDRASESLNYLQSGDFLLNPSRLHASSYKKNWHYYAEDLAEVFAATVTWIGDSPPRLQKASSRFLEGAIPLITGEHPSADAIRLHLTRR
jgi:hypothetical protein